jgi:hypothetical protein
MSTLHQRGLKVSSVSDEYCPQSPLSATSYRERYSPQEVQARSAVPFAIELLPGF